MGCFAIDSLYDWASAFIFGSKLAHPLNLPGKTVVLGDEILNGREIFIKINYYNNNFFNVKNGFRFVQHVGKTRAIKTHYKIVEQY